MMLKMSLRTLSLKSTKNYTSTVVAHLLQLGFLLSSKEQLSTISETEKSERSWQTISNQKRMTHKKKHW